MFRIPFTTRHVSRVIVGFAGLTGLFFTLTFFLSASTLTVLLNGVFIGTIIAIVITYWVMICNAFLGVGHYDRVRQMILGLALCWISIILTTSIGIQIRIVGMESNSTYLIAASRYIAIVAAVLQVSAPDFGLGLFHGRERKALWVGLTIGAVIGLGLIFAQGT